jgi:hypothetical protein
LPSTGGTILLAPGTTFDLGAPLADGLTITISNPKHVEFLGSGASTVIQYTGTGYAIKVSGTTSNAQMSRVGNFRLENNSGSRTTGRHGIIDQSIGPRMRIENVHLRYFDDAITIRNSNTRWIRDCLMNNINVGIRTLKGRGGDVITPPNACYIENCQVDGAYTTGIWLGSDDLYFESGTVRNCVSHACACNIKIGAAVQNLTIEDCYLEGTSAADVRAGYPAMTESIYLKGITGAGNKINQVTIQNVQCNALENTANMIKIEYVDNLLIQNCKATGFTNAMVVVNANTTHTMTIINPRLSTQGSTTTPFLVDTTGDGTISGGGTGVCRRNFGTVIEGLRHGQIVMSFAQVMAGDVQKYTAESGLISDTTVASENLPCVVMYGSHSGTGRPCVVATEGFTVVNVNATTAFGDTLVTNTTAKQAAINNAVVDPKKIIGYAMEARTGAGLVLAKIC